MTCGCMRIFNIICTHLCFNKDDKTVLYHMGFPTLSSCNPANCLYSFFFFHFFLTFPNVHSPGDIWVLTADHYIVTAPAFVILDVEKWQVAPIKWQTSKEWHYCNRHVMNGKIESLCSFHLIFDKKKKCWFLKCTAAINSQPKVTTVLHVPFPDIVFIKTYEHFGMGCSVKIFHRSAAKPQWDVCDESC